MGSILVVEDEPDIVDLIEVTLFEHRCVTAADGHRALAILEQQDVAIVLLDLMVPKLNGEQVLRALRDDPRYDHLPVLVVTARATKADEQRLLDAGADGYLTKPFPIDDLRTAVEALLALSPDELVRRRRTSAPADIA